MCYLRVFLPVTYWVKPTLGVLSASAGRVDVSYCGFRTIDLLCGQDSVLRGSPRSGFLPENCSTPKRKMKEYKNAVARRTKPWQISFTPLFHVFDPIGLRESLGIIIMVWFTIDGLCFTCHAGGDLPSEPR